MNVLQNLVRIDPKVQHSRGGGGDGGGSNSSSIRPQIAFLVGFVRLWRDDGVVSTPLALLANTKVHVVAHNVEKMLRVANFVRPLRCGQKDELLWNNEYNPILSLPKKSPHPASKGSFIRVI